MTIKTVTTLKLFLAIFVLTACSEPLQTVTLEFSLFANNHLVNCKQAFQLTGHDRRFSLQDSRFYLSNIALINDQGDSIPLQLHQTDNPWQFNNIALIDLASSDELCSSTKASNSKIVGDIPQDNYKHLTFTLGVPFGLNHNQPAFMRSPLNIGSMFWSWQLGYKFLRIDLMDNNHQTWFFHLGSTNCHSASTVKAPISCDQPNRTSVQINNFDFKRNKIRLNLDALLANAKLVATSKCMSHIADNNDCQILFNNLSLNVETGACIDKCIKQKVFTKVFTGED